MRLREWRVAVVAACLAGSAAAQDSVAGDGAQDLTGDGRVLVELATSRDTYFVHEPISVRIRIRIERDFLRTNLIQLFRQPLDIPAQLVAPWIDDLPGAVALEPSKPAVVQSLALNDGVTGASVQSDLVVDGRPFSVVEVERRFSGTRPGELTIPSPVLRFAYATRFTDDFVAGRVASDRSEAFVRGAPRTITIAPLPDDGRPHEFTGAVGRFSCWTEARPAVVEVGESLKLVLHIEGEGNLDSFDPPRLEELAGFDLLGVIDDKGRAQRTITYDIAPRSADITQVPPIPFAFFDTGDPESIGRPPQYRLVSTSPISIVVQPSSRAAGALDVAPQTSAPAGGAPARRSLLWLVLIAALVSIAAFVFVRSRARREPS